MDDEVKGKMEGKRLKYIYINNYTSNILIMRYKKTLEERMKKSPYGNTKLDNGVSALLL